MQPWVFGFFQRVPQHVDIVLFAPCKPGDFGGSYAFCDLSDRFEVAFARGGIACLDNIDVQALQRVRHGDFLVDVHTASGGLFAVS